MNEEQLLTALRNAHAAGDTAAARRFAGMIQQLRSQAASTPASPTVPATEAGAPAAGAVSPAMAAALAGGHPPSPRERAAADVATMTELERRNAAQNQGAGSMAFGVGTPLTAAGRMIQTALPGGEPFEGPREALEYARGRREALLESNPLSYAQGAAAAIALGPGAAGAAAGAVPAMATGRSIFALQQGQRIRNIARMSAAGGAAAGVTEAMQEGLANVPGAAATGAVLGPVGAGIVGGAAAIGSGAASRFRPARQAMRILARRLGEPIENLERRFTEFLNIYGRAPRLNEILRRETSEELAMVGRVRSDAGRVLREEAETARLERPAELERAVRNRGATGSEVANQSRMEETIQQAAGVTSQGFQTTGTRITGARDVEMNELMESIGEHRVPVVGDMFEQLRSPDVYGALPAPLRRRIAARAEAGEETETFDLTVREWDMIRRSLARQARSGPVSQIFRELRQDITDYVGAAVPEYAAGLARFGQLTDVARGTQLGRRVLTEQVSEFSDRLRLAGGGTLATPLRPDVRQNVQAGARIGARTRLADAMTANPDQTMRRIATDARFRANVRAALEPDEADRLERLAEQYGYQVDFAAGFTRGRGVRTEGTTEEFREAVAQASQPERAGIRVGTRTDLAEAAGESPSSAVMTGASLAEDPGLQTRIQFALGGAEAARLRQLGEISTHAVRSMEAAVPSGTQASARYAENAQEIQKIIGAGVVAGGRASGAMIANVGNWIVQHTTLSRRAAETLARRAMDPRGAAEAIAELRATGIDPTRVLEMYRNAATASGIVVGGE